MFLFAIKCMFCKYCGAEVELFFSVVMNWRWRIGFLLQIIIWFEPNIAETSNEVGKTGEMSPAHSSWVSVRAACMDPSGRLSDLCQSTAAAIWQLSSFTGTGTMPQTSASSSVHRGGELALVIRAESEWGEQRRAAVLHDFWQAWLRTREQSWRDRTTAFLFFSCKCTKCTWCLTLLNVKACCPMMDPEWGVHKDLWGKFLTNGRWKKPNKWASADDQLSSICSIRPHCPASDIVFGCSPGSAASDQCDFSLWSICTKKRKIIIEFGQNPMRDPNIKATDVSLLSDIKHYHYM